MGKKLGLAESLMSFVAGLPKVTRVSKESIIPGNGKRRVKIARGEPSCIRLYVSDPDHPRHTLRVDTTDPTAVAYYVEQYLVRERIQVINN
jgi:hypothetical protein